MINNQKTKDDSELKQITCISNDDVLEEISVGHDYSDRSDFKNLSNQKRQINRGNLEINYFERINNQSI